jgi:hypothetical protein
LLVDIHDVTDLLAVIEETRMSSLLDELQACPRGSLLVTANAVSDEIATYRIDRTTAECLGAFARPKTYAEFRGEGHAGPGVGWEWADIRELCKDGILEMA